MRYWRYCHELGTFVSLLSYNSLPIWFRKFAWSMHIRFEKACSMSCSDENLELLGSTGAKYHQGEWSWCSFFVLLVCKNSIFWHKDAFNDSCDCLIALTNISLFNYPFNELFFGDIALHELWPRDGQESTQGITGGQMGTGNLASYGRRTFLVRPPCSMSSRSPMCGASSLWVPQAVLH